MGRKTLERQVRYVLSSKMKIGESRHQAKADLRAELGDDYRFGMATDGIHSIETRSTYQKASMRFVRWCVEQKGVSRYERLENIKYLVKPYLQYRKDAGLSGYTLTTERSALGKLYGEPVDFPLPKRTPGQITRSRHLAKMDAHFSEQNNKDEIAIARGTGGRRGDEESLCVNHFREIGGIPVVDIFESKGGRNRTAPILPGMEKEVAKIVADAKAAGREELFDHIHTKMDVHSYRREYAQKLYKVVSADPKLRARLLTLYPPRRESVKSDYYTMRRRDIPNQTFLRDDLYIVSQALGHNRLDVTVTHYLL